MYLLDSEQPYFTGVIVNFSIELVDCHIRRLSGLTFRLLGFPRDLEWQFEETTRKKRSRRLWLEGLIALFLFDTGLVLEHFFAPEAGTHALWTRLWIITPAALLINFSMLLTPGRIYRESSIALFACFAGLTELALQSNVGPIHTAYAQFTAAAVLVFANTVIRLRVPHAIATSSIIGTAQIYFCHIDHTLAFGTKLLGLALALCTTFLTLMANYSLNREERLSFLLCLRGDLLIEELSCANQELGVAAECDGLTALANRYAFDRRLNDVWKQSIENGKVVSLILVDVDHFKRLNDKFGHLYGDKVLRRVAHLLSESLRRKEDMVARFGGEEFVILLPGTVEAQALLVAERLRNLIELAGLPALETPNGLLRNIQATVSCGVASGSPIAVKDPNVLLDAADKALYHAKAQGRNRTCLASNIEAVPQRLQAVTA